jgi:dipeptidyl aminopeptidase/acylaminoacyl peptidase
METKSFLLITLSTCLLIVSCSGSTQVPKEVVGHWEGITGTAGQSMNVVFNFSENKCSYDAPDLGIYGQAISDYSFKGEKFSITIPERKPIVLKGFIRNNQMTGEISGKSPMTFSLERKSNQPEFFYEENVTYKSGDVTLSGTLIKPESSGKYPVVVMIHGSSGQGKMTRETTRSRAILFVKSGIAALIYDRRGNGKSTGEDDRILRMELLAKDAAAGVEYLSTRTDVNIAKIGVYGISQGGWVAPYAINFTNKINFVITVSAPGITPDEQNDFASGIAVSAIIKDNLKKAGVPNPEEHSDNQTVKSSSTEEILPGFSHFNPLPYWEKITVPVLAVWGEADDVVPAEKSKKLIEESLIKSANTNYTLKIFPRGDHLLRIAPSSPQDQTPFKPMVQGVQDFMVQWIKSNLKANP